MTAAIPRWILVCIARRPSTWVLGATLIGLCAVLGAIIPFEPWRRGEQVWQLAAAWRWPVALLGGSITLVELRRARGFLACTPPLRRIFAVYLATVFVGLAFHILLILGAGLAAPAEARGRLLLSLAHAVRVDVHMAALVVVVHCMGLHRLTGILVLGLLAWVIPCAWPATSGIEHGIVNALDLARHAGETGGAWHALQNMVQVPRIVVACTLLAWLVSRRTPTRLPCLD